MATELKTLKDLFTYELYQDDGSVVNWKKESELKKEAIRWIKNLRTNETYSPILIDKFPDTMKGSCIIGKFRDCETRLAMEYGMIMMIMEFFNITEEELDAYEVNNE